MSSEFKNRNKLRKYKSRENEIFEQRKGRLLRDYNQKWQRKVTKSAKQCEARLARDCERKQRKAVMQKTSNSINTEQRTETVTVLILNKGQK
ncbi:hypothetical protein F8M41_015853 [Gigaspora margarita]|uniref:Uncharacterized protein n=1 Tax=Gigaspora margarita TaxID=4874 RepID=A0A8H4AQ09_GIGMA|nr:hypothetical protein F8M41_015853 [Gigaspora margarita]